MTVIIREGKIKKNLNDAPTTPRPPPPKAQVASRKPPADFTREEIDFIRNEMYASICAGADDPLFQAIYDKARLILRWSNPPRPRAPSNRPGSEHGE